MQANVAARWGKRGKFAIGMVNRSMPVEVERASTSIVINLCGQGEFLICRAGGVFTAWI